MNKFELTEDMYNYISLQRTGIKNNHGVKYYNNIKEQWETIKHLINNPKKVLDIGCGIGGIDYFIGIENELTDLYLLDKTQIDDEIYYGLKEKASFYNNLDLSERFLRLNGLKNNITILNPDSNFKDIKEIDIVISLISWGFHYPISTYIDIVDSIISKNGLVILDIRHTILNESINEFNLRGFKHQTICEFQKCSRIVFKKW